MSCQPTDDSNGLPYSYGMEYTVADISQNTPFTVSQPIAGVHFSLGANLADDEEFSLSDLPDIDGDLFDQCLKELNDTSIDDLFKDLAPDSAENGSNEPEQSMNDDAMSVQIQPPTDIRRRYVTDGKRQLEKSRSEPMTIRLPNLPTYAADSNQSLWLQLALITTEDNPHATEFLHQDQLEYHADGSETSEDGFVRVPLTHDDIIKRMKRLARISIIKKKLQDYSFQLKPYNPLLTNSPMRTYDKPSVQKVVAKAKCLRDDYHLSSSRIACQILYKDSDAFQTTDIVCKTNVMEERQGTKRSASTNVDDEDEEQIPKKTKSRGNNLPINRA